MKSLLALGVLLLGSISPATAQRCDSLQSLEWLLGEWRSTGDKTVTTESWTRVSPKTFEGRGETRSKKGKEILNAESLRLVEMSGEVFYWAKVSHNERPIAFKLVDCPGEEAVFENKDHDFPRKIEYRLTKANDLTVVVSDGQKKGFTLFFSREQTEP